MILPVTAHPALRKAAHYLSVRPVLAPPGEDFRVAGESVKWLITPCPIMLLGGMVRELILQHLGGRYC